MVSWDAAADLVSSLPEVTEGTHYRHRSWSVKGKVFAWERPFSKADRKRFGATPPPDGPILALTTGDLSEKDAILAEYPACFTIPHFDGYAAVLVRLNTVSEPDLRELVTDAWAVYAPAGLVPQLSGD